jgi:hypothetical protein
MTDHAVQARCFRLGLHRMLDPVAGSLAQKTRLPNNLRLHDGADDILRERQKARNPFVPLILRIRDKRDRFRVGKNLENVIAASLS